MMNWLLHNPIASMRGLTFLFFYIAVIMLVWFILRKRIQRLIDNEPFDPLPLPSDPDPYAIAFLRGQENAVADLALLRLFQAGALKITDQEIVQTGHDADPPSAPLTRLEKEVYKHFAKKNAATVNNAVRMDCQQYRQSALKQGLITENWRTRLEQINARSLIRNSKYAILGLGLYKLAIALINGHHNIIFLVILMIIVALGFSFSLRLCFEMQSLTARGKDFLKRFSSSLPPPTEHSHDFALQMLCFAALGFAAQTTFVDYYTLLSNARTQAINSASDDSSSGCSSSGCSSSGCSSSSGCASGCGGCGGGGGD